MSIRFWLLRLWAMRTMTSFNSFVWLLGEKSDDGNRVAKNGRKCPRYEHDLNVRDLLRLSLSHCPADPGGKDASISNLGLTSGTWSSSARQGILSLKG